MAPAGLPHPPPRSPGRGERPLRRRTAIDRATLTSWNGHWLAAYASSTDPAARLRWRNRLVEANLGLVHSVAARYAGISQLPFNDLVQVGCQGLIRAVEAFDHRRARCLSTFAMPYVRGAIQHEIRDREAWIRPPRPLWDLHQRAKGLLERRRVAGLPPLRREALAAALDCSLLELDATQSLRQTAKPLSLDALQSQGGGGEGLATWLDQLADPRSLPREAPPLPSRQELARRAWLHGQLSALDPSLRELLLGRVLQGCTWVELGRERGLHPRMAERRCNAALRQLRMEAESWRQARTPEPLSPQPLSAELLSAEPRSAGCHRAERSLSARDTAE
ncbi:MAG: sigma-70 family RNA polymerase sigma factor [Cyanobacteriota bacterium]|nr:sigma-70 family RNA polymerase sigma factor [Cyanobacteriota bacterium]